MAFSHGSAAKLFVHGYDLTAYFNSVRGKSDVAAENATTFSKTAKVWRPGLLDGLVDLEGLFDGDTNAIDDVLAASIRGTDRVIAWLPPGLNTLGQYEWAAAGVEGRYDITTPVNGLARITAQLQASAGLRRAVILATATTSASTVTGTGVADAAATTNYGGIMYVQVTNITGSLNCTFTIEYSDDNVTYIPLTGASIALAPVTVGGFYVATANNLAVYRHTRVVATISSAGPALTFHASFHRRYAS